MSKTEENLINKIVTLYLDGGWELTGLVKSFSEKKIVLEQVDSKELFLAFRDKVSCLKVGGHEESDRAGPGPALVQARVARPREEADDSFPMNKIAYDDSGMNIPQGMLENFPEDDSDDFSISFGGKQGENPFGAGSQIEFRIKDDSKKED